MSSVVSCFVTTFRALVGCNSFATTEAVEHSVVVAVPVCRLGLLSSFDWRSCVPVAVESLDSMPFFDVPGAWFLRPWQL
jgi:hypothetical protein